MTLTRLAVAITAATFIGLPGFTVEATKSDAIRNKQWHLQALRVSDANKISSGQGVVVGVVDTGISRHPDLQQNLLRGTSVISGSDDDGRTDPNGHGTKMASLIAAHGRSNDVGVVGIAPDAKLLPVRDSDAKSRGTSSTSAAAIEWAAEHRASIINFSGAVAPSLALQDAIKAAEERDVLVVAATGNRSQDVVAAYPASMPGILAVGASDKAGKPAPFSAPNKNVQICAPGDAIQGATANNGYSIGRGTSSATAIVSGAAALVRSKFPDLSAQEVIHRLTSTATDIGPPGRDDQCGYGLLNIVAALTAPFPTTAAPTTTPAEPTGSPPTAAPPAQRPTSNTPLIAGGIVAALAAAGALTFLTLRRRRNP